MDLKEEFSKIYGDYLDYLIEKLKNEESHLFSHFISKGNTRKLIEIKNEIIHVEETATRKSKGKCNENDLFLLYQFYHQEKEGSNQVKRLKEIESWNNTSVKEKLREKEYTSFVEYKKAIFFNLIKFISASETSFEKEVSISLHSNREERLKRLAKANTQPEKRLIVTPQYEFIRNPDVVAEVLFRANGVCERCQKNAPFKKDNGEPYLEVHHKKPLSENGDDTVENCIALCPNCHRHAHHGKNSY